MREGGVELRRCPVTGELLADAEFVSRSAVNQLVTALSDLPDVVADLQYRASAGSKDGLSAGGGVASSKEPFNLSLMVEVWQLMTVLQKWGQALTVFVMGEKYWVRSNDPVLIRQTFIAYRDQIRGWSSAPEMVIAVKNTVARLEWHLLNERKSYRFAGWCPECGEEIRQVEGAADSCECGYEFDFDALRRLMIDDALNRLLSRSKARELAEMVMRRSIPKGTVRSWVSRGQLKPERVAGGRLLYRARDMVELMGKKR